MSKFNLKNNQNVNGDDHIERRLQDQHKGEQDSVSEVQLEGNRVEEKDVLVEKLLDKVRNASDSGSTERRLNESKSNLVTHRNEAAYKGDINKLEEQRIANKPQESEKYVSAETPKKLRWWEKNTSKDGLKTAAREFDIEETNFDTPRFNDIRDEDIGDDGDYNIDEIDDDDNLEAAFEDAKDFADLDTGASSFEELEFINNKELQLARGKISFSGDREDTESLVNAAVDWLLEKHPNLEVDANSFDLTNLAYGELKYLATVSDNVSEFKPELEPGGNLDELSDIDDEDTFAISSVRSVTATSIPHIELLSKKK